MSLEPISEQEEEVIWNNQHRLLKGKSCMTSLIASCGEMDVGMSWKRKGGWISFILTLVRLSAVSSAVFLCPDWDIAV